jgi:DNA adenine methylase
MLKKLMPIINSTPHQLYCEPFCGGAAVLLAREPGQREIINDIDGDLINLYRQAKYHRRELIRTLRMLPESRELFYEQQAIMKDEFSTEIQKAAAFAYVNFYCFGADNKTFGTKRIGFSTRHFLNRKLIAFSKRIDRVTIEHISWERCLALYDCPGALFFCDPPYTKCGEIGAYEGWTTADVERLHDALSRIKGRYIVTLNDCPENRAIFKGCSFYGVTTSAEMKKMACPGSTFKEIIIVSK